MPLALAALLPFAVIGALIAIRRGVPAKSAWGLVVVVMAILAVSAVIGVKTGEDEEDVVEEVVDNDIIHEHEERGALFRNIALLTLLVGFGGLAQGKVGSFSRGAGTGLAFMVAFLGWRAGESGGDLVYEHGAANAYIEGAGPGEHDDDDDDDDDHEDDHDEDGDHEGAGSDSS